MRVRAWPVAAALVLSTAVIGCSQEREDPTPPPPQAPRVEITALSPEVVATTARTVGLAVTDTGGASVTVTTSLGTFDPGGTTTVLPGGSGTVLLRACGGCNGTALVTATSTNGSDQASVRFVPLAAACLASCSADGACPGQACTVTGGGAGTCSSTTCVAAPACTPATETCTGGADEDCDGTIDCADDDCAAAACAGGPTFYCQAGRCTDVTSGLAVTVTPARSRLPANGTTTTEVEVEVTLDAEPVASLAVNAFVAPLGTITPATAVTGADGKARFTFRQTAAVAGVATVTASLVVAPTVTGTATITLPQLAALEIVTEEPGSSLYKVMGARGSGWKEYGWLQVRAIDERGLPYPDDLAVLFEHRTVGGSSFMDPSAATSVCLDSNCLAAVGLVATEAGLPESGLAKTWVRSGTVAGTLAFTATASAGGSTRSITLPTIAVVGAKASAAAFGMACSPRNLPALAETDCSLSLVDAPFTCEAHLKDRFGNVLGRETQVTFHAEAAAVGQVTWTPAYDGDQGPRMDLGVALQQFTTLMAGLPFDVEVDTTIAEPSVVHGADGCGVRTHNPRDGLVTMVAIADGEEAFWDANGNGSFDAAEPFVDQGEPFVDQNDDGTYQSGEWFLDVDRSEAYTPRNGRWDANTKIWTQTVVLYSAQAATIGVTNGLLGTRIAGDDFVDACTSTAVPPAFDIFNATTTAEPHSAFYTLVASDWNLNFPNAGTTYATSFQPQDAPIEVRYVGLDQHRDWIGLAYRYWPCDQNGVCEAQCRATGSAAPCTMKPEITGGSCGYVADMTVTAGDEPGAATVWWEVNVPWTVYDGVGSISQSRFPVSGIVR